MTARIVSLAITGIAHGGEGVGRLDDGRVAFVPRSAPGDRVRAEIVRDGGRWVRARVVAVDEPSAVRRDPPCPLFDRCGGCQLQHLTYEAQLEAKGRVVADALERIGGLAGVEPPPVAASPDEFGYRNRVTFTLRRLRGGRVVAGFHAWERPARVVDVDERCMLPEAAVVAAWAALRANWGPGACLLPAAGELRLTLRGSGSTVLLAVEGGEEAWHDAETLAGAVPALTSVWHRSSAPAAEWQHKAGASGLRDAWFGGTVPVGPGAFVQVNRGAAEALHQAVIEAVGEVAGRHIVDAYAGVAAYGRHLAAAGADVTAIELDAEAVAAARQDAPAGLKVVQGRVEERLAEALPADVVIFNPPRTGLDERVPETLGPHPPGRVVYVSCDPATLARDLRRLGPEWVPGRVVAFDLFPQTSHVETLVILERNI